MTRRCQNQYRHCTNNAVRNTGNSHSDRLCTECLERRREKQRLSAAQPNCKCGNKAALGKTQCSRCELWQQARADALRANGITEEELAESARAHDEAAELARGQ